MELFFNHHKENLEAFSMMSCEVGKRPDYVQGGGGNTSVKLDGALMAIKASGYHLCDVQPQSGYAVLSGDALRDFYMSHNAAGFEDVEAAGAARAKELTREIPGLKPLRPSVEAGFHSLLSTFVTHSHSVYANLAACCDKAEEVVAEALKDAPYSYALVPYVNPGALLTFTIRDTMKEVMERTGKKPAILVMRSHGLIAHADTAEDCLALHEDANARFMKYFGVNAGDFPLPRVRETAEGFESDTPWLQERLATEDHPIQVLLEEPMYPDQLVFFQGVLGHTAHIHKESGRVTYIRLPEKNAKTLEETLCAVVFIRETLVNHGLTPISMGEAARAFIASWESEKYRKSLAEGK
ncbi:MAG: hypothetical protein GX171_00140 [Clostridiales bacterium]|jgi:ribulose-5-phosphate 4-epimerase/fuculose-1-phosphate aldolase|nr:hypothetical protein [Clostridiales bacterium]